MRTEGRDPGVGVRAGIHDPSAGRSGPLAAGQGPGAGGAGVGGQVDVLGQGEPGWGVWAGGEGLSVGCGLGSKPGVGAQVEVRAQLRGADPAGARIRADVKVGPPIA